MTELQLKDRELRKFGLTLALVFSFFFYFVPLIKGNHVMKLPCILILALALVAIFWPRFLGAVQVFWNHLGSILSAINTQILIGIIYFVIFVPFAVLARFRRNDKLGLRLDANIKSYRRKSADSRQKNMERIF